MADTIVGVFRSPGAAAAAIRILESRGVRADQISVVASDSFTKESFAVDSHTKLPEGVAIGATSGAALGAVVAGLTAVGAIATGGLGIIAAGPIVAALAGAGAGAAGGGAIGGLVGLAIPEHEVKHYEDALEKGNVLVGVSHVDGQEKVVRSTLKDAGATNVSTA